MAFLLGNFIEFQLFNGNREDSYYMNIIKHAAQRKAFEMALSSVRNKNKENRNE